MDLFWRPENIYTTCHLKAIWVALIVLSSDVLWAFIAGQTCTLAYRHRQSQLERERARVTCRPVELWQLLMICKSCVDYLTCMYTLRQFVWFRLIFFFGFFCGYFISFIIVLFVEQTEIWFLFLFALEKPTKTGSVCAMPLTNTHSINRKLCVVNILPSLIQYSQ